MLNNNPRLFYHFSYYLVPSSIYESVALTVIEESDKMSLASKLASNVIKKAPSGPVRISYRRFINWGSFQMMSVFQLLLLNKAPYNKYSKRQYVSIHNIDFCSWILAVLSKFTLTSKVQKLESWWKDSWSKTSISKKHGPFWSIPTNFFCPSCFIRDL